MSALGQSTVADPAERSAAYEWDTTNHFMKWTFAVANVMMRKGYTRTLTYDDLMRLPKDFRSAQHVNSLSKNYKTAKPLFVYNRLLVALFSDCKFRICVVFALAIFKGGLRIATIIFLRYLLHSLLSNDSGDPFMWVGLIAGFNLITFIVHGILYYSTMKLGWIWKMAVTGYVYNNLFELKSSQFYAGVNGSLGTGKLVNMISNDVARLEEFAVFAPHTFASLLEGIGVLVVLAIFLNIESAVAGVGVTLLFIPFQIYLGGVYARIRTRTAAATDKRVRFISEVIEGISSVKCFGWEVPFIANITRIRNVELNNIVKSQYVKSVNMALYCAGPSVANFATFAVYWRSGGTLTIPLVFFGISMLLSLRETFGRAFSRSIETTSETISACTRIEQFLDMVDKEIKENRDNQPTNSKSAAENQSEIELIANPSSVPSCSNSDASNVVISIPDSTFSYSSNGDGFCLRHISLQVRRGELVMVVGSVGAGKSTLLNALLGELSEIDHTKAKAGDSKAPIIDDGLTVAYCSQRPWIVAATVKSNIVLAGQLPADQVVANEDEETDLIKPDSFKYPSYINDSLYALAVRTSRIDTDMTQWEHGDGTEIGERGISVSGGQKARIALARAVYADSDVYLLDDVLSAVDAHVGKALFFDCIVKSLKGRGKAVVLATHQVQYLKYADKVLVLDNEGNQAYFGEYAGLLARQEEFRYVGLSTVSSSLHAGVGEDGERDAEQHQKQKSEEQASKEEDKEDSSAQDVDANKLIPVPDTNNDDGATTSTTAATTVDTKEPPKIAFASSPSAKKQLQGVQAEKMAVGALSSNLWYNYVRSGGLLRGGVALLMAILSQGALMMADYWLKWWAVDRFGGTQDDTRYVWLYAILTALSCIFAAFRALSWFEFTINASRRLHELALWALFHTKMGFFVANPTGRVLNRFSRDQNLVDENLPYTLYDCLENGFLFLLASLCLVCVSVPWLVIMVPFVLYVFNVVRVRYSACSREIRRIESTLRSPIYSDLSATLEGLVTLRAYKLRQRATHSFLVELDCDSRAYFNFLMVSRWLSCRLDFICLILILGLCCLGAGLRHTIDVGLLGFALTYSFAITTLLQWTVRQLAEGENMMTSVERIAEYTHLPPEEGYRVTYEDYKKDVDLHGGKVTDQVRERSASETKASFRKYQSLSSIMDESSSGNHKKAKAGELEIKNLTVRYHAEMDPVLRNLSVKIPAGAKVGICGRTGSGKSSTLLALLRLNLIQEGGDILLDGTSLLHDMSLEEARGHLSTIPQDPHLFSGTVRFNVDPFNSYTDEQIWCALEDACIKPYIAADPAAGGLNMMVDEGGKNFSVGQRQLLSMSRAILRRCPVVLMDEVTASIDYDTDRSIQRTIRMSPALRHSTIITVAHRLRTIADSDLILVISAGQVVEYASPAALLREPGSVFRALAVEANELEEITRLAQEKENRIIYKELEKRLFQEK